MSEFVAGAFVDVKPDPAGFRAELKRIVESAIANTKAFKIPIEADPKRFKSTIQAAIRDVGKQGVPIEASMNKAAFRADVKKKVDEATKGLKVIIPVEAGEAKARKTRTKATTTAAAIPEQVPGQIPLPGLQRAAQAQVPGEETKAIAANTTATKQAAKAKKELTDAEQRAEAVKKSLKTATDQQTIAERLLAQANLATTTQEEKSVLAGRAKVASANAEKALNAQLATSGKALNNEEKRGLETTLARATATRQSATVIKKNADEEAKRLTLQKQSNETQAKAIDLLKKEAKSFGTLAELHDHQNDLISIDSKLRKENNRAQALGLSSVEQSTKALRDQIDSEKVFINTQRDVLKGEGKRAKAQKTAQRGAFATVLSLLGVRGATLAANSAFLVGAASAALFAKSLGAFAKFEVELNTFQAVAGASAEQMTEVAAAAKRLGADITLPAVTAADAAQAMTELARAGLGVRDSLDGARGVLELAAAAQISNAEAATLTASALNAFGLAGDQAVRVADLLAAAANASQGSIAEMGAAMQQASAIARQVGISLNDTVAILTLFARNGLRGSDAGTSFRTAMSRLIAPTKEASILIETLGLNLRDAQGNLRPDIFAQFGEATQNLTPALRDMIAQSIAGQDAIRAFSIGAREGARGLRLARLQTQQQGAAAAVAAARTKGLAGSFSALRSNTETLGTSLGGLAAGPAKQAASTLNSILVTANQLIALDFEAFGEHADKSFGQFVRNMKRHAGGLEKIVTSFDPRNVAEGGFFRGLGQGLKETVTPAGPDPEEERINAIREALERLNAIRVKAFQVGGESNIKGVTTEIERLRAELRKAKVDAGLVIPVTPLEKALAPLRELKKETEDFKKSILKDNKFADVSFLDQIIHNTEVRIKLTADNFGKTVKKAASSKDIASGFKQQFDLIAKLPALATPEVLGGMAELANKIKGTAPLTGAAGREVGRSLIVSINAAIKAAVEEDNADLAADLKKFADKIAGLFAADIAQSFKSIKVPLTETELADALLPEEIASAKAEAFGSVGDQIRTKQAELEALKQQLNKVVEGSKAQKTVLDNITAKQNEIASIREKQASDVKEANQKADKFVIDAIGSEERKRQNALVVAQASESLKDDLKREVALREFYLAKIDQVNATVRDAETRRDQLADLNQKLFDIEQDIIKDRAESRAQIRDEALARIDDAAERAAETETLQDDQNQANRKLAFWRNQVKIIKKLVRDRKATADELDAALDELDEAEDEARAARRARRQQVRDLRNERLDLKIQIAQDTGNVNAEIAARQEQINNTKRLRQATKAGSIERLRLTAQLRAEEKELEDLKNEKKEASEKGTTVFELLSDFAGSFSGGNLIGRDQPFAGPTGFVSDISQFLIRQPFRRGGEVPPPKPPAAKEDIFSRNDQAHFGRLTTAVEENTAVWTGRTRTKTTPSETKTSIDRNDRAHYATAVQSRRVREGRSGI